MSKEQTKPLGSDARGSGVRALVVEDDPSWQQILGEILNDCGLVVDLAFNYENALRQMHELWKETVRRLHPEAEIPAAAG